ncbi:hypothetical protein HYQ44_005074 [Verticillium longisporum]|nr:hypothetical protein HYQ44_005074 [Verticillium longisporum]
MAAREARYLRTIGIQLRRSVWSPLRLYPSRLVHRYPATWPADARMRIKPAGSWGATTTRIPQWSTMATTTTTKKEGSAPQRFYGFEFESMVYDVLIIPRLPVAHLLSQHLSSTKNELLATNFIGKCAGGNAGQVQCDEVHVVCVWECKSGIFVLILLQHQLGLSVFTDQLLRNVASTNRDFISIQGI